MLKDIWARHAWLRQIIVGLVYACAYLLIRISLWDANFPLTAALRFSVLLLTPTRYWGALVVGELVPLSYVNALCVDQYGLPMVVAQSIPPIALAMPIVWWCRTKLALFPTKRQINFKTLMICALSVSTVWALANFAVLALVRVPANNASAFHVKPLMIAGLLIGKYIALLVFSPWVLMLKIDHTRLRARLADFARSQMCADTLIMTLPALLVLGWLSLHGNESVKQILRMAMFLPAAWLTLKHGWKGAALGGTLAVASVTICVAARPDPEFIQAQAFIGLTVTLLYFVGARISAAHREQRHEWNTAKAATKVAQQGLLLSELRLQQAAKELEQIGGALQLNHNRLLERFKHLLPSSENQSYHRQAASTSNMLYRLSNSLHPIAWRDRGIPAALQETIFRTCDEAGMAYQCDLVGKSLNTFSPNIHAALYRVTCEAVVYLCSKQTCSRISVMVRSGCTHGQKWIVVRVSGALDPAREYINDPQYQTLERDSLALKLGAHGLGLADLREQARIFDGELHAKTNFDSLRITVLLHDVGKEKREHSIAPARNMWVV